jgi:soluble lytic murein transglycosylase-like protein
MRLLAWLLAALLPVLAYASADKHVRHKHWTNDYDHLFRKYAKHYFGPHIDWHWFKAQGIAESGLNAKAKSPVGALGIMQIMPATYEDIRKLIPFLEDIREPRWNIAAGVFYDRHLYRKWKRARELHTQDRLAFALGSYNAGYGTMLRAYKRAQNKHGDIKRWNEIAPFVPGETRAYVKRIRRLMSQSR